MTTTRFTIPELQRSSKERKPRLSHRWAKWHKRRKTKLAQLDFSNASSARITYREMSEACLEPRKSYALPPEAGLFLVKSAFRKICNVPHLAYSMSYNQDIVVQPCSLLFSFCRKSIRMMKNAPTTATTAMIIVNESILWLTWSLPVAVLSDTWRMGKNAVNFIWHQR